METKEFLSKLCCKNIHFRGNLKLIGKINEENVNNINESFLLKKGFGLQLVHIKVKIFYVLKLI